MKSRRKNFIPDKHFFAEPFLVARYQYGERYESGKI